MYMLNIQLKFTQRILWQENQYAFKNSINSFSRLWEILRPKAKIRLLIRSGLRRARENFYSQVCLMKEIFESNVSREQNKTHETGLSQDKYGVKRIIWFQVVTWVSTCFAELHLISAKFIAITWLLFVLVHEIKFVGTESFQFTWWKVP